MQENHASTSPSVSGRGVNVATLLPEEVDLCLSTRRHVSRAFNMSFHPFRNLPDVSSKTHQNADFLREIHKQHAFSVAISLD